ncbi:MAG: hypothetical protein ACKV1O_15305, partial [Saprospiraceae bacterium]
MKYTLIPFFFLFGFLCSLSAQTPDLSYTQKIAQHRAEYKADFLTEARSPLTALDTAFLDFFPANIVYRFDA